MSLFSNPLGYDEQYLHYEAIYSLNKRLFSITDSLAADSNKDSKEEFLSPGKDYWATPMLFNKDSRSWHVACVLEAWDDNAGLIDKLVSLNIKICIDYLLVQKKVEAAQIAEIHRLTENVFAQNSKKPGYYSSFCNMRDYLDQDIHSLAAYKKLNTNIFSFGDKLIEQECLPLVVKELLTQAKLYWGLEKDGLSNKEKCRDFIYEWMLVYHAFKLHRDLWLQGMYLRECRLHHETGINWLTAKIVSDDSEDSGKCMCSFNTGTLEKKDSDRPYDQYHSFDKELGQEVRNDDMYKCRGLIILEELSAIFYLGNIMPHLDKAADEKGEFIESFRRRGFFILPIHDTWLGDTGCGGIWGVLIFFFKNAISYDRFFERGLPEKYQKNCQHLSSELERSALTTITNQVIKPPYDLIDLFVKSLVKIQDWEWVSVYGDEGNAHLYCYHRESTNNQYTGDHIWKKCHPPCDGQCYKKNRNCRELRWSSKLSAEIWSTTLMPELSEQDIEMYQHIQFSFGFPESSFVLTAENHDETAQKLFELQLIEQQIRILRSLLTKVHMRRSALRNAVVSIMGRNMSHNIGSHVLARYAAKRNVAGEDAAQFMRYLQERMDFIADISTSEIFFKLPTFFRRDMLAGLIGADELNIKPQKVILEHISGLDNVPVTIVMNKEGEGDQIYDSPSGRLGMQAFYVLLENIARNTAKHSNLGVRTVSPEFTHWSGNTIELRFYLDEIPREKVRVQVVAPTVSADLQFNEIECVKINGIAHQSFRQMLGPLIDGTRSERELGEFAREQLQAGENRIEISITHSQAQAFVEGIVLQLTTSVNLMLNVVEPIPCCEQPDSKFDEDLLQVTVWDDSSFCTFNNGGEGQWLPDVINQKLHNPMILGNGEIDPNDWGIREIFLAAAYLRGVSLQELESWENWPVGNGGDAQNVTTCGDTKPLSNSFALLRAVPVDEEGNCLYEWRGEERKPGSKYTLGYQFYLQKRQLVLELMTGGKRWGQKGATDIGVKVLEGVADGTEDVFYSKALSGREKPSYVILPDTVPETLNDKTRWSMPIMSLTQSELLEQYEGSRVEEILAASWWKKHLHLRLDVKEEDIQIMICGPESRLPGGVVHSFNDNNIPELNQEKSIILFDNHGKLYNRLMRESNLELLDKIDFYEPFRKENPQYSLLHEDDSPTSLSQLKTAALSKIIILDERIQAMLHKESRYPGLRYEEILSRAGIYVPTKRQVDLDSVAQQQDELVGWFEGMTSQLKQKSKRKKALDYLVIHQTLIDKLRSRYNSGFDEEVKRIVENMDCLYRVVICSGRGNPRNRLPEYGRFLPVSVILEWTINNPSKIHLVNQLAHARKPHE